MPQTAASKSAPLCRLTSLCGGVLALGWCGNGVSVVGRRRPLSAMSDAPFVTTPRCDRITDVARLLLRRSVVITATIAAVAILAAERTTADDAAYTVIGIDRHRSVATAEHAHTGARLSFVVPDRLALGRLGTGDRVAADLGTRRVTGHAACATGCPIVAVSQRPLRQFVAR